MSEDPKKPLPFTAGVPGTVQSGPISDEVRAALMVLLADTVNDQTILKNYNIPDAKVGELELGTWKITVAQVG